MKIQLITDSAGYIDGWTDEQFADKTKLTEVDQAELDSTVLGATKLVDGHLVVDNTKVTELNTPEPTAEQQMIAALFAKISALEAKQ